MRILRRILAVVIAAVILCSVSAVGFAEASAKEEVVYIMTDGAGSVDSVNVVNIFDGGEIVDYGDYSAVKNMTTTDEITQQGDQISLSSSAQRVYYQGTLDDAEIPWTISLEYIMDGTEYTPEEVAGQSGHLVIHFCVTENPLCDGNFYQQYALEAAFTLSTEQCDNIQAPDATFANVGSDKQLSFIILPGEGIDTTIEADVTDFSMEAVSINGIQLNLQIDLDDESLMEQVQQFSDAISQLKDGSDSLNDGAGELTEGASALGDGLTSLGDGASELDDGVHAIQAGLAAMQGGLTTLTEQSDTLKDGAGELTQTLNLIQTQLASVQISADQLSELTSASGQIKTGIDELVTALETLRSSVGFAQYKAIMAQNGLDIDQVIEGNQTALESLPEAIEELESILPTLQKLPTMSALATQVQELIDSLQEIETLLIGDSAAISGMELYLDSVSSGIDQVYEGAVTLQSSYAAFDTAISGLTSVLENMLVNLTQLADGIGQLASGSAALESGIDAYTDGVVQLAAGFQTLTAGVSTLADGSSQLLAGAKLLSSSGQELVQGTEALQEGTETLDSGVTELYEQTSDLDSRVQDQIDEILSSIQGEQGEITSFVSEKNTNIRSVQFVIKTAAIEQTQSQEEEQTQEEHLNFWQKLLRLFGLY